MFQWIKSFFKKEEKKQIEFKDWIDELPIIPNGKLVRFGGETIENEAVTLRSMALVFEIKPNGLRHMLVLTDKWTGMVCEYLPREKQYKILCKDKFYLTAKQNADII